METTEIVKAWVEKGHMGVDMETATTFAIAKKFDRKAVGLLNLSDRIIEGGTLYTANEERDRIVEETDMKLEK